MQGINYKNTLSLLSQLQPVLPVKRPWDILFQGTFKPYCYHFTSLVWENTFCSEFFFQNRSYAHLMFKYSNAVRQWSRVRFLLKGVWQLKVSQEYHGIILLSTRLEMYFQLILLPLQWENKGGDFYWRVVTMAYTGVLPFVRGVDFTRNDFSVSIYITLIHSNETRNAQYDSFIKHGACCHLT